MNGRNIPGSKWSRRKFITSALKAGGSLSLLGAYGCHLNGSHSDPPCTFVGANSNFGHLLKTLEKTHAAYQVHTPILIIGGGVAGLTVGYELWNQGVKDFIILDNASEPGGNAISGKNEYSSFPWGAHYLALPNQENRDLLDFLEKNSFITGYNEHGIPFYKDEDICQTPQERLFIKNKWQEGIVPHYGIAHSDAEEIKRFMLFVDQLKNKKNNNGKHMYDFPFAHGAYDQETLAYDHITLKDWLKENKYKSEVLNWFLNYGTKDDYGTMIDDISALVGLHYFAARRGEAANGISNTILTWPEGNHQLVDVLSDKFKKNIRNKVLAFDIQSTHEKITVQCVEDGSNEIFEIVCDKCVLATPQYINKRLLKNEPDYLNRLLPDIQYSPWLVANITVKDIGKNDSFVGLCWDNVIYGSDSLGYVYAQHQQLDQVRGPKVITWYYPITHRSGKEARDFLRNKDEKYWLNKIQMDLEVAHPGISKKIMEIQLWEWGHAMVKPLPGVVSGLLGSKMSNPIRDQLFFCHSDLSGISLFEEAFFHGMRVSKEILKSMHI